MQKGERGYKEHQPRLHSQLSIGFVKRFKGMRGAVVFDHDGNKVWHPLIVHHSCGCIHFVLLAQLKPAPRCMKIDLCLFAITSTSRLQRNGFSGGFQNRHSLAAQPLLKFPFSSILSDLYHTYDSKTLPQMCNTVYPKQWRQELWKGPIASVSNSIFQPVEVVQPEGRNGDLHTFTYPQLCTPHHPWDGVTTGVHLQAKRPFPTGPSGPHCAFVPQWDPMPLQSPANHLLQRQSHLCRPRVNLRTHETLTARTPSTQAVTFPPLLLPKRSASTSRLGPRLKTQLYQIPTFSSFPSVCLWTAWPGLLVQTCLFSYF